MQHLVGLDATQHHSGRVAPVVLDTQRLINGHMLFAGMSGMGKSYQMMSLLASARRDGLEVDVFDPHEELHATDASAAKFSEATLLGYNPLQVNPDPHSGGPRRQTEFLIDVLNRTSSKLGPRQQAALRSLLGDVYRLRGIEQHDPRTWHRECLDEQRYNAMIEARDYRGLRRYYPILQDLISYGERKLRGMAVGSDFKTANALERVDACARRLRRVLARMDKAATDAEGESLKSQLEQAKDEAIEAFAVYVGGIETGQESAEAERFTNPETLRSVLDRLEGMLSSGVMRANPPDWGDARIRIYKVGSLLDDDRKLLFFMRAQAILRECMDAGVTDRLRRILMVDEGHLYYSEDNDNPINRIAKEGRKFGLGLVIGSQSPTHFSEDFLTNCGTIFLMGINPVYWDMAVRKLNVQREQLEAVRAREVLLMQAREVGAMAARFRSVIVNTQVVTQALRQLQRAQAQSRVAA